MSTATVARTGPVLSAKRAAEYCGISVKTLYNLLSLRHAGDADAAPKPYKHGQLTVFYSADLDAWLSGRITDPEA
ncbi:helix-turn-helix transcriptional regulator [Microbacterium sp. MMO-56]|uniref:helix-turn-helix transcriptional regulator n=1 Tax=Microbacterium sp. MMO-56 TaxID=3081281 RepID=UPI00301618FA